MKYKVGDEFLLKAKVVEVDEDDSRLPYKVTLGDRDLDVAWIDGSVVFAVIPGAEPVAAPAPEPARFKVGDWVIWRDYEGRGPAKIIQDDESEIPYLIKWPDDGHVAWSRAGSLTRAEAPAPKPEPKFKVGDRVIHRNCPEWGIGKVETVVENPYLAFEYTAPGKREFLSDPGPHCLVKYPNCEGPSRIWNSLERFLVAVVE